MSVVVDWEGGMGAAAGMRCPDTLWSIVLRASDLPSPTRQEALGQLYELYRRPLACFIQRQGYSPDQTEDLLQGFFEHLIEKQSLNGLGTDKGRFRTFLYRCLSHFLRNEWHKEKAMKRGGSAVFVSTSSADCSEDSQQPSVEPAEAAPAATCFDCQWASHVVCRALERLGHEYCRVGKSDLFTALATHLLISPNASVNAAMSSRLGLTPGAAKTALNRLRQRFGLLVRQDITQTLENPDPEQVQAELQHLIAVWKDAGCPVDLPAWAQSAANSDHKNHLRRPANAPHRP